MDPNATYQLMVESFMEDRLDDAIEAAQNLREWIAKGGFPPREVKGFNFKKVLKQVLAFEAHR